MESKKLIRSSNKSDDIQENLFIDSGSWLCNVTVQTFHLERHQRNFTIPLSQLVSQVKLKIYSYSHLYVITIYGLCTHSKLVYY
jgi:hypothetical protein